MKNSVIMLFYFMMVLSQKAETVTAASEVGCGTVQVQQKNDDDDDDEKVVVTKTKKNGPRKKQVGITHNNQQK